MALAVPRKCDRCQRHFGKGYFEKHTKLPHATCDSCGEVFVGKFIEHHVRICHDALSCSKCDKRFERTSQRILTEHEALDHATCILCGTTVLSSSKQKHEKGCESRYSFGGPRWQPYQPLGQLSREAEQVQGHGDGEGQERGRTDQQQSSLKQAYGKQLEGLEELEQECGVQQQQHLRLVQLEQHLSRLQQYSENQQNEIQQLKLFNEQQTHQIQLQQERIQQLEQHEWSPQQSRQISQQNQQGEQRLHHKEVIRSHIWEASEALERAKAIYGEQD